VGETDVVHLVPDACDVRGLPAVAKFFQGLNVHFSQLLLEPQIMSETDKHVIVINKASFTSRETGKHVSLLHCHVWTFDSTGKYPVDFREISDENKGSLIFKKD
jgi:hypothetical protein